MGKTAIMLAFVILGMVTCGVFGEEEARSDELASEGDLHKAEALKRYHLAKQAYEDAKVAYETIKKDFANGTATPWQCDTAKKKFRTARKWMELALYEVEIKPTLPESADGVPTKEELRKQWDEARDIRKMDFYMKEKYGTGSEYIKKLERLEELHKNHAASGYIFMALARAHLDNVESATDYYRRAAEYPIESDLWGLVQQDARREWAEMLAEQGNYKEAVKVLSKWEINGWCGTGTAGAFTRKAFQIWRWRLEYEKKEKVYADMWRVLDVDRDIISAEGSSYEQSASYIRSIYGNGNLRSMKRAMMKARGRIKGNIKSNRASEYHGRELNKVLDELEEQVKYIERIKKASADELGHELINVGKKNHMLSHWGVSRLFVEESLPDDLWQERVVLEAAKAKKSEISLELLEGLLRIRRNPVALCAIGQSGTQEAVQLLKRLASKEKAMRALRNYYFCLLLTGRTEAEGIVKEAAKSQEKSNVPAAGKWALQEYAKIKMDKDGER